MFDVGFSEMIVVAIIALIVLGPEKLPKVARTVGHLLGRMQRYVNDVKADINREIELDELRKLQQSMQETARSIEQTVTQNVSSVESELNKVAQTAQGAVSDTAAQSVASDVPAQIAAASDATAIPNYPDLPAEPMPAANAPPVVSPQLELGLDAPAVAPVPNAVSASAPAKV
jgi:sec-independent protein translocase protein TatB